MKHIIINGLLGGIVGWAMGPFSMRFLVGLIALMGIVINSIVFGGKTK